MTADDRSSDARRERVLPWTVGIVVLASLAYAWHLRWVSEDAYISLRYAQNLLAGEGLVFNPGERVEGYTNFLWTILLAGGLGAGLSPVALTTGLGLGCAGATLLCAQGLATRLSAASAWPLGLAALGLNYSWASFSTSGLETSLNALCVTGMFLALAYAADPAARGPLDRRPLIVAGVAIALAMANRPDAALLVVPAGLFALIRRGSLVGLVGDALALGLPVLLLYGPYFLWRLDYYGDVFPNTYYAKSASQPHYEQGLLYLGQFVRRYLLWIWLPVGFVCAGLGRRRLAERAPLLVAALAYVAIHTFYVVRVGGDFMEGRFFVPILPLLYVLADAAFRSLDARPAVALALGVAFAASSLLAPRTTEPGHSLDGITDERAWTATFDAWLREGEVMGRHLPAGTLVATDAIGAFGFSSGLPIVDTLGLTDRTVAREPLVKRGRPGHEKIARPEYLLEREVALVREGLGRYAFGRSPDFVWAGNQYFLLTRDPAVRRGFELATAELEAGD